MKKKVLYGVALALVAGVGMGTLQSCKDDLSDLRQEVVYNQGDLLQKLDLLQKNLDQQIKDSAASCRSRITLLNGQIIELRDSMAKKADKTYVNSEVKKLQDQIDTLVNKGGSQAAIDTLESKINRLLAGKANTTDIQRLDSLIGALNEKISSSVVIDSLQSDIEDLRDDIESYKTEANSYADNAIKDAVDSVRVDFDRLLLALENRIGVKLTAIDTRVEELETLTAGYEGRFTNITNDISSIQSKLGTLETDQQKLAADLIALATRMTDQENITKKLQDNYETLWNEVLGEDGLKNQLASLRAKHQQDIDDLNKRCDDIVTQHKDLFDKIFGEGGLSSDVAANTSNIEKIYEELAKLANLGSQVEDNTEAIMGLISSVNGLLERYNELSDETYKNYFENKAAIGTLQTQVETLQNKIASIEAQIANLENQVGDHSKEINTLKEQINTILDQIDGLNGQIRKLQDENGKIWDQMNVLFQLIDALPTMDEIEKLKDKDAQLAGDISKLTDNVNKFYNENKDAIAKVAADVAELQTALNNLTNRVSDLITGILIQATDNPIFGNFSLPIGIKSNLLFNWYGYNDLEEFMFPNPYSEYSYDQKDAAFTPADLKALAPARENIGLGYLGEVDLGRLYLTINPLNHNFTSTNLKIEGTDGNPLPYTLKVQKSSDKLYWGGSRATVEGNGFYSADVTMPATSEAINATKIQIEEGLKDAAKDLLKDRTKRNAVNLLKALYSQMSNMLPMYGVRYNWTSNGQNYGVLSNYDLAVATAKPLSYEFLYGKSISKRLPHRGPINDILDDLIDKDKFKFELNTDFKIDSLNIKFEDLSFNLKVEPQISFTDSIVVTVQIPDMEGTGKIPSSGEEVTVSVPGKSTQAVIKGDDLKPLIDAIAKGFSESIDKMNTQLGTQINDQIRKKLIASIQDQVNGMLADIQSQINKMLSDLEGQINDQISKIIDDLMSSITGKVRPLFDKVNDAIDVYNKVADKINNVLEDPNHYLQVAMFYKGGKAGVNILSTSKKSPTRFKNAGGDAISLYASSYTGEILAPAYKKYIAVTNVYNADGTENKAEQANIKAINEASGLNKVFPGFTKRVGVAASKLKTDLVYEIVYQGVDYSGKTSTQKFYIKVVK